MRQHLWEIALSQITAPSFYGKKGSLTIFQKAQKDYAAFVGPPRNLGKRGRGPTALPCILKWFMDNPDDTITVDDLAVKFEISGPTAYRIQRILSRAGEIFLHTRPGRKSGIQYGRLPPLEIPTKKDIRPEPKRKYVRKVPI